MNRNNTGDTPNDDNSEYRNFAELARKLLKVKKTELDETEENELECAVENESNNEQISNVKKSSSKNGGNDS